METNENAARRQAWDQYWGFGTLHSCPGSYVGNYGGALGEFWNRLFLRFEQDMRVLDLGSGNGALAALMISAVGEQNLPAIDAVDFATPRPYWLKKNPGAGERIRFHEGVAMEALPFDDASFDRIISQYGFEYADPVRASAEVIRVARPGAEITMVCHHHDSRPARVAGEEVGHIDWLLEESPLMTATSDLIPWMAMSSTPEGIARLRNSPEANQAREAFNEAMGALAARANETAFGDLLVEAHDMCQQAVQRSAQQGEQTGREMLSSWREALVNARLRSRELCENALDEAGIRAIAGSFEAAGFETAVDTLHEQKFLMGWTLTAHRGG